MGVPSSITTFLFDLDYIVIDHLMAEYNDIALAAAGIVLKAERLPLNIGIGICQGMNGIVWSQSRCGCSDGSAFRGRVPEL